jgi:hypothetical protein
MSENYSTEKIIELINSSTNASIESIQSKKKEANTTQIFSEDEITRLINETSDEIIRKEQVDYLSEQVKKRFIKIKSFSKENFNMFEVAMQCHKLVNDYRQLAKEKGWKEIEKMFSKKEGI